MKKSVLAFTLFFFVGSVFAAASPLPMLQNTANQLIGELKQHKAQLRRDPQVISRIVTRVLLPHVDQQAMARSVVPRNIWLNANARERQAFISEFRTLVIRTYAAAFAEYEDETVQFRPIRGDVAGRSQVSVYSVVIRSGKPNIPVTYELVRTGASWKIIDFSVEGVSMVRSFRSQFAGYAQQSLSVLTNKLREHNRRRS